MVFKFMKVGGIAKGVSKDGEEGQSLSTGVSNIKRSERKRGTSKGEGEEGTSEAGWKTREKESRWS